MKTPLDKDHGISFDQWRARKLAASELSQLIHEFHQGESRHLWSMYQTLKEHDIDPLIDFFRDR
jgi:hypothetical protein